MVALVLGVAALVAFQQVPVFRYDVTRTLRPDSRILARHGAGFLGFDDGARLAAWTHEGTRLVDSPLLGRGFFNRFPGSGLWWTGSHSFWIQMFLETGVPGGVAILTIIWSVWRESRRLGVLPEEVALLVAFVGGMGGEYFYGGMPLLVLTITVTPLRLFAAWPVEVEKNSTWPSAAIRTA